MKKNRPPVTECVMDALEAGQTRIPDITDYICQRHTFNRDSVRCALLTMVHKNIVTRRVAEDGKQFYSITPKVEGQSIFTYMDSLLAPVRRRAL